MKKLHKIIAASLLASATTAGSGVVLAESPLTGNIAVASNYVWRGKTASNDTSAVSGGIDYSISGFTLGTWVSNTAAAGGDYEQDIYAGYAFDAGPVGLDVGYISYLAPVAGTSTSEVYVNASFKMFSVGVAVDSENKNVYTNVGAEFEVKKDLMLGVTIGSNDADGSADDYTHYQVALSKDDFTFAYDKNDDSGTSGKSRFTVSWSQSFDL